MWTILFWAYSIQSAKKAPKLHKQQQRRDRFLSNDSNIFDKFVFVFLVVHLPIVLHPIHQSTSRFQHNKTL